MAFSLGRLIGRRLLSGCSRMSTATAGRPSDKTKIQNYYNYSSSCCCSSPWLMLPPTFNDDDVSSSGLSYNFYSLAENRVLTPRPHLGLTADLMPKPIQDLKFCGSSHGWLALYNPHTMDLFLYDPFSHRHIKLPPIPEIPKNIKNRSVTKLILSSSPDEDERNCRAMMIFNCSCTLAFCCPGHSKKWTPIGKTNYSDLVYSSRQNLFFARNQEEDHVLETWDLNEPSSPRKIKTMKTGNYEYCDFSAMSPKQKVDHQVNYLVVVRDDKDADHVLLVCRHVMKMAPDGSYVEYYRCPPSALYPYMTIDFSIDVCDQEKGVLKPLVQVDDHQSLGDWALFVGCGSHSVALSATRFPELKPNSIYFTDSYETRYWDDQLFGGHDIGIFDYENKTVSPCYYPCDVQSIKRILPSPKWFFPRGGGEGEGGLE